MPWKLSGNSLLRSSVDLIEVVFLGVGVAGGAGAGLSSWEVFWITLMAQLILMTSNHSHNGIPRMAGLRVSAMYQQGLIW